ncbi:hypothetical protein EDB85DRAFT_1969124 [Lactarius pseudohatsudake]|nr:hypothetical protein EDB85DRAFT_1969124 [Lactarius pseudohatsudake]
MYPCPHAGCSRVLKNKSGLTQHRHFKHGYSRPPQRQRSPSALLSPSPSPSPPPVQPPSPSLWPRDLTPIVNEDEAGDEPIVDYHTELDGQLFDEEGIHLHGNPRQPDDWYPYTDRVQFETADLFFRQIQLSASQIDTILRLWSATLVGSVSSPPFQNHRDMYKTIDQTPHGDIPWSSFTLKYNGEMPTDDDIPTWMTETYQVCYRDPRLVIHGMLAHPGFKDHMDYVPYHEYDPKTQERRWRDLMSGDWAWMQADEIAKDPSTHGSTFVPVILGSDKTVVSVATGNTEYWPLYLSIGNVRNSLRRAHKGAVAVIGFLSIPKTKKKHASSVEFRQFKRKLFHSSITKILQPLHAAMTSPELVLFGDGHYRRVVYGLGPYIADYEEQVLLACIVRGWCGKCMTFPDNLDAGGGPRSREQLHILFEVATPGIMWDEYGVTDAMPFTSHFPRADIYELLAPDILHQLIKGTFKDHLVTWVEEYLEAEHGPTQAREIMDDIDKRISVVPPFSRLRRFPQGRGFEQWTGDDSKALMKVYLPAIEGHVPSEAVRCFRAFLEFCYIARSDTITERTILNLEDALRRFHDYRSVFQATGVRLDISLPRQHSMMHYSMLIRLFGAPNGLCSSITESKHIKAVKEPWRRSNRYHALLQMLVTNQRLDKLAAARANFEAKGLLGEDGRRAGTQGEREINNHADGVDDETQPQPQPIKPLRAEESDVQFGSVPRGRRASDVTKLSNELKVPDLPRLINRFLCEQLDGNGVHEDPNHTCPRYAGRVSVFNRAIATFHTPSDPSNDQGMRQEVIRATPSWLKGAPRHDCIFINSNNELNGMRGMEIARAICFFSFVYFGVTYPCVLVHWFSRVSEGPDEDTGMWMVTPDCYRGGDPILAVIHIDCIFRAAHLVPIFGNSFIPDHITHDNSLDSFKGFYVNRFIDHHAFDFAS